MPMNKSIKGLLLDMDGVLYVGNQLIDGARETIEWLRNKGIPFRFITNTTTRTPDSLIAKLDRIRLKVRAEEVFTAVTATLGYLKGRGEPSCHLLLRDEIKPLFKSFPTDADNPDYVVIGDIGATWNYENLNKVFNMLMRGSKLICMHRNKFWQGEDGLKMDIGAFVAALEYVSDKSALVIGKPSPAFFQQALQSLGLERDEVAILGDDIDSDIGGGQASDMRGILVMTGKYREEYVSRSSVRPDFIIESIKELPRLMEDLAGDYTK